MKKESLIQYWKNNTIITNQKVISAFKKVKREDFILKNQRQFAYEDVPLSIGFNATISQPTTVMIMTQALEPEEGNKILEIGTGSGYQAALLSVLVGKTGKIITTEMISELADFSRKNLENFQNVTVILTDGSKGYEEEAPFDRILVTAASPKIPNHLYDQLKDPGILLVPAGDEYSQELIKVTKKDFQIKKESLGYFQFVPLKGKFGFK